MSELLKRLEMERMQGNFALNNYPNDEYWVNWDELVNVFEEYAQPQLNENQQIVLEYLKSICPPKLGVSAMVTAYYLANDKINDNWQEYSDEIQEHIEALQELTYRQQAQVLESFSQLALEQEEW